MFYCTLCCNSSAFLIYVTYSTNPTIFTLGGIHSYNFVIWSAIKTDRALILNIFPSPPFSSKFASFDDLSTSYTNFISLNDPSSYHEKRITMEIQNRVVKKIFIAPPAVAVLVLEWRAGLAGHWELLLLLTVVLLTMEKLHPPHQTVWETKNPLVFHRTIRHISPFLWELAGASFCRVIWSRNCKTECGKRRCRPCNHSQWLQIHLQKPEYYVMKQDMIAVLTSKVTR